MLTQMVLCDASPAGGRNTGNECNAGILSPAFTYRLVLMNGTARLRTMRAMYCDEEIQGNLRFTLSIRADSQSWTNWWKRSVVR